MDHRCLYGHRVPESFTFAIERRICPTCGAGTVTLEGYQLARRLAAEVPLQAVDAFNTVLFLQRNFDMSAKGSAEEAEAVGAVLDVDSAEQAVEEPEVLDTPTQNTVTVRPAGAREEIPDHPSLKPHASAELIAADAADEDEDASAEELAFFSN
ncbi:MAG: hypothetical protein H6741_03300 [Alphaproteobacteria bacterium]|nr:hypothetical protein [Alphaproteobacteria bacterium]